MSLEASIRVDLGDLRLEVELDVERGEVVALLGPNGAGKTTLIRAIAGLTPLAAGRVAVDGDVLEDCDAGIFVPAEQRPIAVVFQDYLLFPHLDALDNVAFGLRCRGMARAAARRHALRWLARVGMGDRMDAMPSDLSGGQSQRVALARALALEPTVLLLDEPLSALDVTTRGEVRRDLRRHLAEHPGIHLLVTHDPLEAMALADRLVVLERGRVIQAGTPAEITERPRSAYAADLVGVNLFRGRANHDRIELDGGGSLVAAEAPDGEVLVVVHPRAVALYRDPPGGSPRNVWPGRVKEVDHEGRRTRVWVDGRPPIVAEVTSEARAQLALEPASEVWVAVKATEMAVYPA